MGTRNEDQPPEHWAGAESLDPTPVWKQFLLVAMLALLGLLLIGLFAWLSLAVQLATPPALVPGGRMVLAGADLPGAGTPPRRFGSPLLDEAQAFWLAQPSRGDPVAVSAWWRQDDDAPPCAVRAEAAGYSALCGAAFAFGPRGEPVRAPRGLDRYLVAVEGDRVVVNVSRVIRGVGQTPQPLLTPFR